MMSLMVMFLTLGPLLRNLFALLLCVLIFLLAVLVVSGLVFLHQQESNPNVIFFTFDVLAKLVDSLKCFGAQIPYFIFKFET